MKRRPTAEPALAFLFVVTVGLVLGLVGLVRADDPALREPTVQTLTDGSFTSRADAVLEERHPARGPAVSLLAAVRYVVFRDASGAAVVGSDGRLFTLEELERHAGDEDRLGERLGEISRVVRDLRARGAEPVVVLLPAKARLAAEKLPRRLRELADHERYELAVDRLEEEGTVVVDLRDTLAAEHFYARDTHWTPEGASVAARAVADTIAGSGVSLRADRVEYSREPLRTEPVDGDLMSFVPVGGLRDALGLVEEAAQIYRVEPASGTGGDGGAAGSAESGDGGAAALFGELTIPVALVGTSYSRDPRWGFEGALKHALGADVLNVASEGIGPFEPMREYLAGDTIRDVPPEIVIWEIPERYLTLPE
ncbi:MAG: alginate O-acetyltransferase AlgX-related protein [Spirochaetales bacterium]